ncbi:Beta-galactosidase [Halotydeus destructor]|nr:Beta-galactosidase [Halotydeus destructor]
MKILLLSLLSWVFVVAASWRTFVIDYDNNRFLKDGQPFRYISGEVQYYRVPRELWRDRLTKLRLAGFNAVQTYIEWSTHEPEPGFFVQLEDITDFIKVAQQLGLLVILRPGPYICSERDFGGFPYWLLRDNAAMAIRSRDPSYLRLVDRYLRNVLPLIRPLLYSNGGPVIMVQVENEYGLDFDDKVYTSWLRDAMKTYLADEVVLFTTDTVGDLLNGKGKIDGVYATVDFGTDVDVRASFAAQRLVEPKGPLVNSEFYISWFDQWSEPHQTTSTDKAVKALKDILDTGASVNVFTFVGGTNFGFKNGAEGSPGSLYQSVTTSYDFDALLTEAGDPTEKYFAMRTLIGHYLPLPNGTLPTISPKFKMDAVQMHQSLSLADMMLNCSQQFTALYPLTFEQLRVDGGYVIYRTTINFRASDPSLLSVPGIRDRAQVILNGQLVGTLSTQQTVFSLPLRVPMGSELIILVENQGRLSIGPQMALGSTKGILGNVTLGLNTLTTWTHHYNLGSGCYDRKIRYLAKPTLLAPAVYSGSFVIPTASRGLDTFLRLDGWCKGVAYVNGINLGRYWPDEGPQVTLYVPGVWLRPGSLNYITLFETEQAPCATVAACYVSFVDQPLIRGGTPDNYQTLTSIATDPKHFS